YLGLTTSVNLPYQVTTLAADVASDVREVWTCPGVLQDKEFARDSKARIFSLAAMAGGMAASVEGRAALAESEELLAAASESAYTTRYGPHIEGPLPSNVAATFRGGSYSQLTLQEETVV